MFAFDSAKSLPVGYTRQQSRLAVSSSIARLDSALIDLRSSGIAFSSDVGAQLVANVHYLMDQFDSLSDDSDSSFNGGAQ